MCQNHAIPETDFREPDKIEENKLWGLEPTSNEAR
jgi:hypothetical protein